jgi:hypothetical protein
VAGGGEQLQGEKEALAELLNKSIAVASKPIVSARARACERIARVTRSQPRVVNAVPRIGSKGREELNEQNKESCQAGRENKGRSKPINQRVNGSTGQRVKGSKGQKEK